MTDTPRRGDWIQVHSGGALWPLDPRPDELHIEDVAQGLAHLCRFGGQCRTFYSVAQHSVLVSVICAEQTDDSDPEHRRLSALAGLLHDAPEAYICDIPRPLKNHLPEFREIEQRLWDIVQRRWDLRDSATGEPRFDDALVWRADDIALVTEKRDLMAVQLPWGPLDQVTPDPRPIEPLLPAEARAVFLRRFEELTAG